MGAIVAPLAPAFYTRPKSVAEIVEHTAGRLLDLFGIETDAVQRWDGERKGQD
jgi:4-hydroxy-3-polyprenylbenzoate decarboxylase